MLYGIPTFITGGACKFSIMLWGGILCWACAVIAIYTNREMDQLLVGVSAILAWFIPGILMEIDYRKAKRELKEVNV
jgi:hypothetical protein